ncbi:MAG: hypothetical protein RL495_663 [Verrucomicrobiota bacterium]
MREDQAEMSSTRKLDRRFVLGACVLGAALLVWLFWPSAPTPTQPSVVPITTGVAPAPKEMVLSITKVESLDLSDGAAVIKAGLAESEPIKSNLSLTVLHDQADKGNTGALLKLGWLYAQGDGVIKDDEEAAKWFRLHALKVYDGLYQRASKGDVEAMGELYRRFIKGVGFPKNYIQGCKWVLTAAASGDLNNKKDLIRDFYEKCDVRPGLSDPLFHETYLSLLREAAFKGGADEKVHLATTLQICADYWKSRALQEGPYPATQKNVQLNLSLKVEAYAWYNVAAAMRHPDAAKKRDALQEVSIAGQKKSREIMAEIEKVRAGK